MKCDFKSLDSALLQGGMHPGKLNPSHSSLYVSYGGEEVAIKEYEILIQVHSLSCLDICTRCKR